MHVKTKTNLIKLKKDYEKLKAFVYIPASYNVKNILVFTKYIYNLRTY